MMNANKENAELKGLMNLLKYIYLFIFFIDNNNNEHQSYCFFHYFLHKLLLFPIEHKTMIVRKKPCR